MMISTSKIRFSLIGIFVLAIFLVTFLPPQTQHKTESTLITQPAVFPGSCTTFFAQIGNTSFFGNNEDYSNPNTVVWVVPSSEDSYGGIYFGYQEGAPQGGINEKGLAFDGLALPPYPMNDHPDLPNVSRNSTHLWREIMAKSANLEEAITIATSYNWADPTPHQVLFADKAGNAAVIGPGMDGEVAVTRKTVGDGYLVATNFNVADPNNTESCWRYDTATDMLAKIRNEDDLTEKAVQNILDAVHVEGDINNTLYSNVFDLNTGTVYLVYWHQFAEVVTLNVEEEIASAPPVRSIRDLFTEKTVTSAETEYGRYTGEIPYAEENYLLGWYALAGLVFLFFLWDIFSKKVPRTGLNLYWGLALVISGVIGFAGYWFSYRKPYNARSEKLYDLTRATGAAAISATGYASSFLIMLLFFYFFFPQGSSGITALLIPFIISLLLFRSPLLTMLTRGKYSSLVVRAILTELISTISAIASVIYIDSVLKTAYPNATTLDNPIFFGKITAYALVSFIVIFPFHLWLARKGYPLWIEGFDPQGEFVQPESEIKILPFKKGWPFLLISIALLVLAVVGSS